MTAPTTLSAPADAGADTRPPPRGRRIGLLNNKGGVGKTWLVVALADALAALRRTVLVVDMDPQANATRRLAVRPTDRTVAEMLRPQVTPGAAATFIQPCGWTTPSAAWIHVLASELALEDRNQEAGVPGSHNRLRDALYGVTDDYDYTLIDAPPALGHITAMIIAALDGNGDGTPDSADTFLLPLEAETDGINGARRALGYVTTYRVALGVPNLHPAGVIVNRLRAETILHDSRAAELPVLFSGVPIWEPHLPLRARIAVVLDKANAPSADTDLTRAGITEAVAALARRLDGVAAVTS